MPKTARLLAAAALTLVLSGITIQAAVATERPGGIGWDGKPPVTVTPNAPTPAGATG
ncbi:hypothetical protein SAMN05192558_103258 [Actinokineospora alba]|uniref:Uncharacterized protein n=1 Tax=Actinokineospora alba TaxID=504798 RepID=A0A1H0JY60_9PSEU|nr:hypothetical protein [Actinokineospora alba]TDP68122.1 hypothetical protein C8E96_3684 [Actinokineospora alba]SDH92739.1 hypothetical protein SAMN05421871_102791 [Actinokineospora alba]SDO48423.1 hypothetical protein SAMN05192558_103258 [Actinokineospora alba]